MPARIIPQLRRQPERQRGDRAYATFDGVRLYFGRWGSPEARKLYEATLAGYLANHRRLPVAPEGATVTVLCDRFLAHAEGYYLHPDGTPTSNLSLYKMAIAKLRHLYGDLPAAQFDAACLEAVRQTMIDAGWSRGTCNQLTGLTRAIFRWGSVKKLVPAEAHAALGALAPLQRGRTPAPDCEPVRPVPAAFVEAVRARVSRQVAAMIDVQLLTGARPGEVCLMRAADIDTSGRRWSYKPQQHKGTHRGAERTIWIGPRAQEVLRPFLADRPVHAYLFRPGDAIAERAAAAPTHRRPDQKPGDRKTARRLLERYTPASYRHAIRNACEKAGLEPWHPHRLRHNAGTAIRRQFGLEQAAAVLGHASMNVTEIYAEQDAALAAAVMLKIG